MPFDAMRVADRYTIGPIPTMFGTLGVELCGTWDEPSKEQ